MSARELFWVVPLGFAVALGAQAPPNIAQGLGPAGAYQTGGVDNVNLMNGGLNLTIPLGGGAGQRGAVSAQTVVVMNSKGFVVSGGQWTGSAITFQVVDPQRITVALVSGSPQYYVATTADGSTHILQGGVQVNGVSYPGYWATDGSGIHYDSTTDIATDRDGVRTLNAKSGPTAIEDPNGNEITLLPGGGYTDTLGRTGGQPVATGDLSGCTGGATSAKNYAFPGANGNSYTYKLCYINLSIHTAFGAPGVAEENALHQAVTTVIRPDGAAWSFTYAAGYGDLQAVTLPTGGTITYAWETESFGTGSTPMSRWLTARTTNPNDGSGPFTWTYNSAGDPGFSTTVTDPQGNDTRHIFSSIQPTAESQFETQILSYQGSVATGTLLKTVKIDYQSQLAPVEVGAADVVAYAVPIRWTTTWASPDNRVSKDERDWDYGFTYIVGGNVYSSIFGQPVADRFYDYGQGTPGQLLRTVTHSYINPTNSDYQNANLLDLVRFLIVSDSQGATVAETENSYDGGSLTAGVTSPGRDPAYAAGGGITARGNLTGLTRFGGVSPNVNLHATFDDSGNRLTSTDGNGNLTSFIWGNFGAYLTEVDMPPTTTGSTVSQHKLTMTYDAGTGIMDTSTDQNGNVTTFHHDDWGRPTETDFPDGGQTKFTYTSNTTEVQRLISGSTYTDAIVHLNGLGLADRDFVCNGQYSSCSGSTDWDTVDTTFNGLGQPVYTSNPFYSSGVGSPKATGTAAEPGDTFAYDALSRRTQIAEPAVVAGQTPVVSFNYTSGGTTAIVLATDEAGQQRAWLSDALGQLTEVREFYAPSQFYTTDYTYSGAGALTSVTQGAQTRSFTFNELGELLSASNPESGTTYYAYDLNANLVRQTEANGTVVSATFDALNRLRTRTFTISGSTAPTGTASFDYDTDSAGETVYNAIGQMTRVMVAGGPVALSLNQYDEMGRLQVLDTIVNGTTYHSSVYYDQIGFPTYEHFPSGRALYLTDDLEGRTDWIGDSGGGTYLHQRYYEPYGAIAGEDLGNGLTQGWHHNDRMQVTEVDAYPTGAYNWSTQRMDIALGYTSAAQPLDNGNVLSLTDNMGEAAQNQNFTYDPLNRISGWSSGGGASCSYTLDRYGNLTAASGSGCPMLPKSVNAANNQIVGYGFDANGNFLSDTAGTTATFDGNNRLVGFNTPGQNAQYVYDGLLNRVEKTVDGVTTLYFRNALGQLVSTLSGGQWTDFVNSVEGDRIAAITPGGTYYLHSDPLGTLRAITDSGGNNILGCAQNPNYTQGSMLTYAPFGQEITGCTQSLLNFKFTGQERDPESGWDYFQARTYASNVGRFLSPDPDGIGADPATPQSWNGYAYVGNTPLTGNDPWGTCPDTSAAGGAHAFLVACPPTPSPCQAYFEVWDSPCPPSSGPLSEPPTPPGTDDTGGPTAPQAPPPDVTKHFYVRTPCNASADQLMQAVERDFSRFGDFSRWNGLESVTFLPAFLGMAPGATIPIRLGGIVTLDTAVRIQALSQESMTFATIPGHILYPASITFSASNLSYGVRFNIDLKGTFPSWLSRLEFELGGNAFEDAQWNHFLGQVVGFCKAGS